MKSNILIMATIVALSASGVTSSAQDFDRGDQGKRGKPGHNPEMMKSKLLERILKNPEMAERIGLSEEQEKTLRDGFFDLGKQKIAKTAELKLAAMEQARILTESEINETALIAAVEESGHLRTELAHLQMKKLLLMRRTLDDQQRQGLATLVREERRNRMERRSRGSRHKGEDHKHHRPKHDRDNGRLPPEEQYEQGLDGDE